MTINLPRVLTLEGASNVRDLGGYRSRHGGRVRPGMVWRAAALGALTGADREAIAALGIKTICDLRGVRESAAAPSALAGAVVRALPIEPSVGASLRDLLVTRETTGEDVMSVMRRAYVAYALDWPHRYRTLFDLLLRRDVAPLLFHCSAGKDRTGFGAALLLCLLGVSGDDVRRDYLATNMLWRGDPGLAADLPPGTAAALLRVHPELLEAAFAAIDREYGGLTEYADRALGLDAERLERLRATLLER